MDHSGVAVSESRLPAQGNVLSISCSKENILVMAYADEQTSLQAARMLCDRQGWAMAKIHAAARPRRLGASLWDLMASKASKFKPPAYSGPVADGHDAIVLVAPASTYRVGGPMCSLLSGLQDFKADIILLTVQSEVICHQGAERVFHWTGRYPVLGMWLRPIELDFIGAEARIRAFGSAIKAMRPPDRKLPSKVGDQSPSKPHGEGFAS
ncbi:hypothetical protein [Aquabacterium sp. CECT 9606]|uniref:hypothetical protein n=1 Tax=Aquabacterium sp. CECT 9606 TaxID=2845822 RepID=UPI001E2FB2C5|nr:hypothetical protein [Aquabacterium sp. CECT 9606]CAH0351742.1 hypothetical protein AQB9606_02407 [Aquabacterium sp. CECT 9606]